RPVAERPNDGAGCLVNAYRGLCEVLGISGLRGVTADAESPCAVSRSGNIFAIQAPAAASLRAELYTVGGAAVLGSSAEGGELTVDASGLAPGVYVMRIAVGGDIHTEKVAVR
ncbi:MAG: T9SS type A sorting domain-containing protein, partial [Muribaculaceae bacterium]|nr:T9SS type A sorting domain-containing protein [Muribaculaceae bacterium]